MTPVFTVTDFYRAATAAGHQFVVDELGNVLLIECDESTPLWQPLSNSDHALRLAVDANIDILLCDIKKQVTCISSAGEHAPIPYGFCKYQAVRSAIFIAAAAIGAEKLGAAAKAASA